MTIKPAKSPRPGAAKWMLPLLGLAALAGLALALSFVPALRPGQDHALFRAVESRQAALVQRTLDSHPQQVNDRYMGRTPLHLAVVNNSLALVPLLLARGADPNSGDDYGNTALHVAVFCHRDKLVDLLLQQGARVNQTNRFGQTPLHVAAFVTAEEQILYVLLRQGADPFLADDRGQTPQDIARRRCPTLISLLGGMGLFPGRPLPPAK